MKAIEMWWMTDILVPAVLILGICGFVLLARSQTGWLTRKTARSAEGLYASHADSMRRQRKYAREHSGQWRDREK